MRALALVKSEDFGSVTMDVYRDETAMWMTRDQIGTALEYPEPRKAVAKLHERHKERLDQLSGVVTLGTPGGQQETVVYSPKGVYEICRWSRQPKADAFFDWVYDLLEGLRTGSLTVTSSDAATTLPLDAETQRRNAKTRQAREMRLTLRDLRDWLPDTTARALAVDVATLLSSTPPAAVVHPDYGPASPDRDRAARNLRFWRTERRLTLRQLGDRVGMSHSGIFDLEQARRPFRLDHLIKLATALHIDVAQFLQEPPPQHGQL